MFYTFTNLQGSQTYVMNVEAECAFYTFTNLQGSQTSNLNLRLSPNPFHQVNDVSLLVLYYTLVLIYYTIFFF